ncbi:MAG: hypothetical protein ACYC35_20250 [Pirellulales bacterium]
MFLHVQDALGELRAGRMIIVMLVALRVTIGWHFLYEGVWKIAHRDEFSARPFLAQAKGPLAPLFYTMVPDLEGRQRLAVQRDESGKPVAVPGEAFLDAWDALADRLVAEYGLDASQEKRVRAIRDSYAAELQTYLAENLDAVAAHFESLDRLEAAANSPRQAEFQQKRLWDKRQELQKEADAWLTEIDKMGRSYQASLAQILTDDQRQVGLPGSSITAMALIDFAVTYGLTAIGLCLVVGLCTRPAALGGAAFLVFVLASQPPLPNIYPPTPEVAGHALVVDKNFVEMIAILLLATTAAGQWAGLDRYLARYVTAPVARRYSNLRRHFRPKAPSPGDLRHNQEPRPGLSATLEPRAPVAVSTQEGGSR